MRIITKTYKIYEYDELSDKAKEKVRQDYLDCQEPCFFTEYCNNQLNELFPCSDLKVEYSLCYCQGDGLNIYGKIYLDEVLKYIKDHFTRDELKFFKYLFEKYGSIFYMPSNPRYCYCICSRNNFIENYLYDLMADNFIIPKDAMKKFNKLAGEYLDSLCKKLEEAGYDYFYEVSEDTLREWVEANEYEFYENGKIVA